MVDVNKEYKYKFSIVMAIYNVEEYIEEAVESLINQENIDFKKDVQVILVNDGSPDNSEKICLKYKALYPDNIVYINKENGGVSSARNRGLEYIEGKYVNFLDADDKLENNVLYKVYEFFEENYKLIDIVAIPIEFFEAKTGNHVLNYKFKQTRIVNILNDYSFVQLSSSSTFIKKSIISKYRFKENMKYAEDAHLLNRILLEKLCYGVISNTRYWYRRRSNGQSATQYGNQRRDWYIDNIQNFSLDLIEYSREKLSYIPKYIQYLIMYDLQWRINILKNINEFVVRKDVEIFYTELFNVLKFIDYKIILEQKNMHIYRKTLLCIIKFIDYKFIKEMIVKLL